MPHRLPTRPPFRFTAPPLMALALLVVGATIPGCQTGDADTNGRAEARVEPVDLQRSMSLEASTFAEPGAMLFKDEATFEPYRSGGLADLEVNWTQSDVVVVALGAQPTGGYWVKLTGAQRVGPQLYVQATASRPGPDAMVTQAVTYPIALGVIEKSPAQVVVPEVESLTGAEMPAAENVEAVEGEDGE